MKKLPFILCFLPTLVSGQLYFQKIIGNANSTYARDVIQVQDTGYVIAGTSTGYGDHTANAFLMKLDSSGNFLWTKWFGGNNVDGAKEVVENADGSLTFVGHTNSFGNGGYDIYVAKTDAGGNLLWQKTYGGSDWDFGYGIAKTSDNGYIITGETYSYGNGNNDAFLLKLDQNGDSLWMNVYGNPGFETAEKVVETYDGRFIFIGSSDVQKPDTSKMWIVKTNADGSPLWEKFYGTSLQNSGHSLIESAFNSDIVIAGSSDSTGRLWEIHVYRLDSSGNFICNYTFGGVPDNDYGYDIDELPNGELIVAGEGASYSNGQYDMKFYHVQQACWWIGGSTYGDTDQEAGYSISYTLDGGFIMAGTSTSGPGIINAFIVKSDASFAPLGTITTYYDVTAAETLSAEEQDVFVFYNPIEQVLQVNSYLSSISIAIYDLSGKVIIENTGIGNIQLPVSDVSAGCYIYYIKKSDGILSGKFIKY